MIASYKDPFIFFDTFRKFCCSCHIMEGKVHSSHGKGGKMLKYLFSLTLISSLSTQH